MSSLPFLFFPSPLFSPTPFFSILFSTSSHGKARDPSVDHTGHIHPIPLHSYRIHRIDHRGTRSDLLAVSRHGSGTKGDGTADRCGRDGYLCVCRSPLISMLSSSPFPPFRCCSSSLSQLCICYTQEKGKKANGVATSPELRESC